MTRLKHAIAIVLLSMVLPGAVATAQDACPVAHVCVDYEDNTIAIDPAQGPVQAVVVQERSVTLTDFTGSSERHQATLAVYIASGDAYELAKEVTVEQSGKFANAELGDIFDLTEAE